MPNVSVGINKTQIYWCKKVGLKFNEPIPLRFNIMPTNNDAEIITYGLSFTEYLRIRCTAKEAELFNTGDKVYFRKEIPAIHNKLQNSKESANFEISEQPSISLSVGEIRLKRIPNR